MATRHSTLTRTRIQQHTWTITESITVQRRCQAKMSDAAFELALDRMQERYGYPTPEQRLAFWLKVEAGLEDGGAEMAHDAAVERIEAVNPEPVEGPKRRVYDVARDALAGKQEWSGGARIDVATVNGATIYLRQSWHNRISLGIENGTQGPEVECGWLNLAWGPFWHWKLTEEEYERWAVEARKLAA